jgi:hypothetical protein
MNDGNYKVRLNFIEENNFICNKGALFSIIENLKKADIKKEYHSFFRLKSNKTKLKFMVRHAKKSANIDLGELDHFQKGAEKKVHRENTPALIAYLEECYELISCD